MGTASLIDDPALFMTRDPEHFAFTVAALSGQFGTKTYDPHESALERHKDFKAAKAQKEAAK